MTSNNESPSSRRKLLMDTNDRGTTTKSVAPRRGGTNGVLRFVFLIFVVTLCVSLLTTNHWMEIITTDVLFAQQQSTIDCNATAMSNPSPMGTKYIPVQCDALQPIDDPNSGRLYARTTNTTPSFWVSLHNEAFDRTRWAIMTYGFYYEKKVAEAFQIILREPSKGRVLDVGGNIGYFTLLSAAMGAPVIDTFEPNVKNRQRMCEALSMNRWFLNEFEAISSARSMPRVNLYPYGVGAEAGELTFSEHPNNPGQGSFEAQAGANHTMIRVIRLDEFAKERGWISNREDIAILKVDVEGFEPSVFAGATELLKSGIVRNILMEISVRSDREIQQNQRMLRQIIEAGYRLHKTGGWMGPSDDARDMWTNETKIDDRVKKIIDVASEVKVKQLNLWWKV